MPDIKKISFDTTEFLAMLAHDMKNPVKAQIRGVNLLCSGVFGDFSDEAKSILVNIIASNKYLECLLDDILNRYIVLSDGFTLDKKPNDLRKTLEESLYSIGILSEIKGQEIVLNYGADNFIKNYDETQIKRVIINFLSNAFKYSKENSKIVIDINNKENKLEFLMKNEKTVMAAKNPYETSYGLGLIICNKIIEAHNGAIINITEDETYISGFILP